MKIILFSLIISITLSISYNLINIKKINFKSTFAFVLDLAIIDLTIYLSIKIMDKYINDPLSLIFIVTGLIIIQLIYFSIFRKIIYRRIESKTYANYDANYSCFAKMSLQYS